MNVICPRCGKDHTSSFVDTKLGTHGYYCEDCRKDFGVDDGKSLKALEEDVASLVYVRHFPDGTTEKMTLLVEEGKKATLYLERAQGKERDVFDPIDFEEFRPGFLSLLFEKCFLLDWPDESGEALAGDDSYTLEVSYRTKSHPFLSKKGSKVLPVYTKVLDQVIGSLFDARKEKE